MCLRNSLIDYQITVGNAHRSLRKLTLLNLVILSLLSLSAHWSAVANDAFSYTRVAFLDVCDTRSLHCLKIDDPAMAEVAGALLLAMVTLAVVMNTVFAQLHNTLEWYLYSKMVAAH